LRRDPQGKGDTQRFYNVEKSRKQRAGDKEITIKRKAGSESLKRSEQEDRTAIKGWRNT